MSKSAGAIAAGVLVVLVAVVWQFGGGGGFGLERSALGMAGLARLGEEVGVKIVLPRKINPPKASELSMAILPIYDLDLDSEDELPRTAEERLGQVTLQEMESYVFHEKINAMQTLIVLPKWRGGVLVTGIANKVFLIPPEAQRNLLTEMMLSSVHLQQGKAEFNEAELQLGAVTAKIALFHPQTFVREGLPARCAEVLGLPEGALLVTCKAIEGMPEISLLSDPDLLNNHGVTLGQNLQLLPEIVAKLLVAAVPGPVYLDTSNELDLAPEAYDDEEAQYYERDGDALARFFTWPLSLLWLAGGGVFAVAIWRGAMRFGPIKLVSDDRLEVSKLAAIDAKARLLRMSGNDPEMVSQFVRSQLKQLAEKTFGSDLGEAGIARLHALFARRNPEAATSLRAQVELLTNAEVPLPQAEMRRILDDYKKLLERLTHGPS